MPGERQNRVVDPTDVNTVIQSVRDYCDKLRDQEKYNELNALLAKLRELPPKAQKQLLGALDSTQICVLAGMHPEITFFGKAALHLSTRETPDDFDQLHVLAAQDEKDIHDLVAPGFFAGLWQQILIWLGLLADYRKTLEDDDALQNLTEADRQALAGKLAYAPALVARLAQATDNDAETRVKTGLGMTQSLKTASEHLQYLVESEHATHPEVLRAIFATTVAWGATPIILDDKIQAVFDANQTKLLAAEFIRLFLNKFKKQDDKPEKHDDESEEDDPNAVIYLDLLINYAFENSMSFNWELVFQLCKMARDINYDCASVNAFRRFFNKLRYGKNKDEHEHVCNFAETLAPLPDSGFKAILQKAGDLSEAILTKQADTIFKLLQDKSLRLALDENPLLISKRRICQLILLGDARINYFIATDPSLFNMVTRLDSDKNHQLEALACNPKYASRLNCRPLCQAVEQYLVSTGHRFQTSYRSIPQSTSGYGTWLREFRAEELAKQEAFAQNIRQIMAAS
jgi:hypothetical protein